MIDNVVIKTMTAPSLSKWKNSCAKVTDQTEGKISNSEIAVGINPTALHSLGLPTYAY